MVHCTVTLSALLLSGSAWHRRFLCSALAIAVSNTSFIDCALLVGELDALLDLGLELRQHLVEPALLVRRESTEGEHLLDTLRPELARRGKICGLGEGVLDIGAHGDLLALKRLDDALSEEEASVGHGERRRACACLGLHNLIATKLDAHGERLTVRVAEAGAGHLREQRQDRDAGVAADDGHVHLGDVEALVLSDKGVSAAHVERRHTAQFLGVIDTPLLKDLSGDWHRRVHGVRDDADDGLRTVLGDTLDKRLNDARVRVEKVVARHARLARHTRRDDDDVCA
mmetsp:Transcript_40519/g.81274  ORF Transcript_40519/g.81274 Transcript_40519/m.81274 type:complete len:285 (+) Transcript_40519:95-949(+)